jgi:hypothetical protein
MMSPNQTIIGYGNGYPTQPASTFEIMNPNHRNTNNIGYGNDNGTVYHPTGPWPTGPSLSTMNPSNHNNNNNRSNGYDWTVSSTTSPYNQSTTGNMYYQSTDHHNVHSVSAMYQKTIDYYHGHQPTMHDGDNDEEREPVHGRNEEQEVTLDELSKAFKKLQLQIVSLSKQNKMQHNQICFLTSMNNQHVANICHLWQDCDYLNEKVCALPQW